MTFASSLPDALSSRFVANRWRLGVYRTPFSSIDMSATRWKRFRLEDW